MASIHIVHFPPSQALLLMCYCLDCCFCYWRWRWVMAVVGVVGAEDGWGTVEVAISTASMVSVHTIFHFYSNTHSYVWHLTFGIYMLMCCTLCYAMLCYAVYYPSKISALSHTFILPFACTTIIVKGITHFCFQSHDFVGQILFHFILFGLLFISHDDACWVEIFNAAKVFTVTRWPVVMVHSNFWHKKHTSKYN